MLTQPHPLPPILLSLALATYNNIQMSNNQHTHTLTLAHTRTHARTHARTHYFFHLARLLNKSQTIFKQHYTGADPAILKRGGPGREMTTTQPLSCSEEESAGGGCAPPAEAKILALL